MATDTSVGREAAAAAARRRQAIIEAERRAAEQRKKEAAAQKARAERARASAKAAQQRAKQSANRAETARHAADQARQRQTALEHQVHSDPGASAEDRHRTLGQVDRLRQRADRLSSHANTLQGRAERDHQHALAKDNEALLAEQRANNQARDASTPAPFNAAEGLKGVKDAGSLSAHEQTQLFGGRSAVTPTEAAQADAQRVNAAAKQGPAQGAAELRRQIEQNPDRDYRTALLHHSRGAIDQITRQLGSDPSSSSPSFNGLASIADPQSGGQGHAPMSRADSAQTLRDLSHVADAVGPAGAQQIQRSVATHLPDDFGTRGVDTGMVQVNPSQRSEQLKTAFRDASQDGAGARFALGVSRQLHAQGKTTASQAVDAVRPDLRTRAAQDAGERAAAQSIQVKTVAQERKDVERSTQATVDKAQGDAARLLRQARSGDLPHGISAKKTNDGLEFTRRDHQGDVLQQTRIAQAGSSQAISTTTWSGGRADRQTVSTDGDKTEIAQATWKSKPSKNPTDPTDAALKEDPSAKAHATVVQHDGEDLVVTDTQQSSQGTTKSESRYSQQTGGDGIHDDLENRDGKEAQWNFDKPVDTVETTTTTTPVCGQQTTKTTKSYSQDDIRATSVDAQDSEGKDQPRQWNLQVREGNQLKEQQFIEGNPDYQSLTVRTATGADVNQTSHVQYKDENGDWQHAHSEVSTQFRSDGTIAAHHEDSVDVSGKQTELDYQRRQQRTAQGLDVHETTQVDVTDPNGEKNTSIQRQHTLQDHQGQLQMLGAEQELKKHGLDVVAHIDPSGQRLTINGQDVKTNKDVARVAKGPAADYAHAAQRGLAEQLRQFADLPNGRKNAASPDSPTGSVLSGQQSLAVQAVSAPGRALTALQGVLSGSPETQVAVNTGAAGLGAAGSAFSLVMNGMGLLHGLQDGNALQIAAGYGGSGAAGMSLVDNGLKVAKNVRGLPAGFTAASEGADVVAPADGTAATLLRFAGRGAGPAAMALNLVPSGIGLSNAIKGGDGSQIAAAGVNFGGALTGATLTGAVAVGAIEPIGGELVGAALGAGVALAGYGGSKLIGLVADDAHDIPDVKI